MTREEILAMKPTFGRAFEFDSAIAERVMGWERVHVVENRQGGTTLWGFPPGPPKHAAKVPSYWWDADATLSVIERLKLSGIYVDVETYADHYGVSARRESGEEICRLGALRLKETIGKVALLAVLAPTP